jgi:GT2 family glycosyltransferase
MHAMPILMTAHRPASIDWMDISVSVVVFETNPSDLAALLQGLSGSQKRVKVTVVDNSAATKLAPVASRHGAGYMKTQRNRGFGAAHNIVLRKTLGHAKYHLVVNPDIAVTSDALDRIFEFMEQHPEIGQVMPRVLNPDGTRQMLCKLLPTPLDLFARRFLGRFANATTGRRAAQYELRNVDLARTTRIPCLSGCFMFLRDSVLQQTGLFDERYFLYMEDFDLCRRIGARASTVYFPEVSVTHGYAKGSYRESRLLRYHIASAWRYFNKWGWLHDSERAALNQQIGPLDQNQTETREPEYAGQIDAS